MKKKIHFLLLQFQFCIATFSVCRNRFKVNVKVQVDRIHLDFKSLKLSFYFSIGKCLPEKKGAKSKRQKVSTAVIQFAHFTCWILCLLFSVSHSLEKMICVTTLFLLKNGTNKIPSLDHSRARANTRATLSGTTTNERHISKRLNLMQLNRE